ncbi:MAG: hypothetical protein HYZ72_19660 [Deltaproteobacteria bacterium]|nr:hypothetical protein [Deltaproteobacteria bacterium]
MLASACDRQAANLHEQVVKYWEARVKGDLERAYTLEVPGTAEKTAYLTRILKSPIVFRAYTIQSIKEDGDQAEVELRMEYLLPGLSQPASSTMVDKWVRVHSRWHHKLPAGDSGTS